MMPAALSRRGLWLRFLQADEARRDTLGRGVSPGVFALTRLKAYDQLASVVLDQSGRPKTTWWPVAFAFQRLEDRRGACLAAPRAGSPYTRAFAVKGLAG
jgi:hypothetical protein